MYPATRRTLIALALAGAVFALAACTTPTTTDTGTPTDTPVATSTVEPTSTPVVVPPVSAGPIATPGTGTALRAAILDAASAGLGVSGKITVYQLFAQDSGAVGDIQPSTGSRMFFALTGGPDDWSIAWSAPFGSKLANLGALEAAAPLVSPELAAKLNWTKKVATPAGAPSLASFKTFVLKSAKNVAGTTFTGTFTITAKIAKDSNGVWWGNSIAEPADGSLESIGIFGRYVNGKWTGEIADFSEDNAEAAYFPADVLSKVTLP
jgi:hypothetical protein